MKILKKQECHAFYCVIQMNPDSTHVAIYKIIRIWGKIMGKKNANGEKKKVFTKYLLKCFNQS